MEQHSFQKQWLLLKGPLFSGMRGKDNACSMRQLFKPSIPRNAPKGLRVWEVANGRGSQKPIYSGWLATPFKPLTDVILVSGRKPEVFTLPKWD